MCFYLVENGEQGKTKLDRTGSPRGKAETKTNQ